LASRIKGRYVAKMLVGRRTECRHLDELLDTVRNGTSRLC